MTNPFKKLWQRFVVDALKLLFNVSKVLPLRTMLAVAEPLGNLAFRISKRYRDVSMKNLSLAFGDVLTDSEKLEITRQVFVNFTKAAIEFPASANLSDDQVRKLVRLDDEDRTTLDALTSAEAPLIAVSAHFGNFELMARRLTLEGYKFIVVVRNDNNSEVADMLNRVRIDSGYEVIGRGNAAGTLLRRMRREPGCCVVMLPDQKSDEVFVPFFGEVTGTVAGPAVLALRTNAPILPIFCLRNPDDSHTLVVGGLIRSAMDKANGATTESLMCEVNDSIAWMVRRYPEQWLWLHDRWRVKPPHDYEAEGRHKGAGSN